MGVQIPPLGAFVLSLCTIITRVLISKAKNKIQRWWKEQKAHKTLLDIDEHFFLYATTNIHIAAHIFKAENLLILLCLHWVSKGWIETKTLVSQCTILNILVLRLINCTECCHKNYFVVTTIRIKVKSLIKKFRKNFISI